MKRRERRKEYRPKPLWGGTRRGVALSAALALCSVLLLVGDAAVLRMEEEPSQPAETPVLVQRPQEDAPLWKENIQGPVQEPIVMAWAYQPTTLEAVPPGVNALAPTWFYIEEGEDGVAEVRDLAEMGRTWDPTQYVETAHAGGAQVWGTVVSFDPDLSGQVVTEEAVQSAFVAKLAAWVEQYDLDGISFDMEKMDPANKEKFTALVERTKKALPEGCVVSVAVTVPLDWDSPNNWWQCYDRGGLAEVCDYIAVMAYDSSAASLMAPTAAIAWVEGRIQKLLEEVPSHQILMGVPFYGIDYQGEVIDGELSRIHPTWNTNSRAKVTITPGQVRRVLEEGKVTVGGVEITVDQWISKGVWDPELGMTTIAFSDTEGILHTYWCEDAKSLYQKGNLIQEYCLGGGAVWQFAFGSDPLWEAFARGMGIALEEGETLQDGAVPGEA